MSLAESLDSTTGLPVSDKSTGGAKHVMTGSAGQAHNRELNAVAGTRVSMTWVTPVTELTFIVTRETAPALVTPIIAASIVCCFDAPSNAVADAWLVSTNSASADSQRSIIQENQRITFQFTSGITRIDFLRYLGAEALTVSVEAV